MVSMTTNQLVEGFFLLALWAPPLAIVAGALLLLAPVPAERRSAVGSHVEALTH
jgi:hypothetical protein